MKILSVTIVVISVLTALILVPRNLLRVRGPVPVTSRSAHDSQIERMPVARVSQIADKTKQFEGVVVRDAKRDKWWMLFVGITVVAYRLVRKHQALFEGSVLYPYYEYEGMSDEVTASGALVAPEFETIAQRAAGVS